MKKGKPSSKVYCGSLYSGGRIVEKPAILIDGDVVLRWGEMEEVENSFNTVVKSYGAIGVDISDIVLIQFDKYANPDFTIKDVCYILRRCVEFSASGFAENLRVYWGTEEFLSWLKAEEERVFLKVEW